MQLPHIQLAVVDKVLYCNTSSPTAAAAADSDVAYRKCTKVHKRKKVVEDSAAAPHGIWCSSRNTYMTKVLPHRSNLVEEDVQVASSFEIECVVTVGDWSSLLEDLLVHFEESEVAWSLIEPFAGRGLPHKTSVPVVCPRGEVGPNRTPTLAFDFQRNDLHWAWFLDQIPVDHTTDLGW